MNNQAGNDQSVQPPFSLPGNDQPVLLLCGGQQGQFNSNDLESLDLAFRYELHRKSHVPVSDALKEFKSSLLNGIAEKLKCSGAPTSVRGLRSNPVEKSQETVVVIESTQSDLPESNTPCSVPVRLGGPTTCDSIVGSMIVYVHKGTPATSLSEVQKELLFFIRTSMAADSYESQRIRKVIYIENLGPNPLESNTALFNTNIVWQPQSEGGSSSVFGIVLSLLVILLIGFTLFIFVIRKRSTESFHPGEHAIVERKPDDSHSERTTCSTEGTWRRALHTEEVWRDALDTYDDKPTESADGCEAGRGTSHAEPTVAQTIDEGVAYPSNVENENHKDLFESHEGHGLNESSVTYGQSGEKKRRKLKKKKKKMKSLDPDEKMQDSANNLEHELDQFDITCIHDEDKALEPIGFGRVDEAANANMDGHNSDNDIQLPSDPLGKEEEDSSNHPLPDPHNKNEDPKVDTSSPSADELDQENHGSEVLCARKESSDRTCDEILQASTEEYKKLTSAEYDLD